MKKDIKQYIPFGIAMLLTLQYLLKVFLSPDTVDGNGESVSVSVLDSVQFGAIGLVITLMLILLKRKEWKIVFALIIVSTFTPWIQFWDYSFSFGISPISLDLIALTLLISHLMFNSEILKPLSEKLKTSEKELDKQKDIKAVQIENRIKEFEKKFSKKSNKELERIVEQKELIPEALEAAKRILQTK